MVRITPSGSAIPKPMCFLVAFDQVKKLFHCMITCDVDSTLAHKSMSVILIVHREAKSGDCVKFFPYNNSC